MRLDCIRHGQTYFNLARRWTGWTEDSLTSEQIAALADVWYDASGYDAVYCSALPRTHDTARCLGISAWREDARINERHFGDFTGLTSEEMAEADADAFARLTQWDRDFAPRGGESRGMQLAKVMAWLREIEDFDAVLAVTHGGVIDFLYRMATDEPMHGGRIFAGPNVALSSFEIDWPKVTMLRQFESLVEEEP